MRDGTALSGAKRVHEECYCGKLLRAPFALTTNGGF
jgi:hypothetical protein